MEETRQRQIAYVTSIIELKKGQYIKKEGWQPSYIKSGKRELSRVNLIGVLVSVQEDSNLTTGTFDDSTGMVDLLFFEKFEQVITGQLVNLIGKVREYNGKKAIIPEIIKKLENPKWAELRALELKEQNWEQEIEDAIEETSQTEENTEKIEEEVIGETKTENKFDNICSLIKEKDTGNGADFQEIIELGGDEATIKKLLTEGEIFEISPGKLKVLD